MVLPTYLFKNDCIKKQYKVGVIGKSVKNMMCDHDWIQTINGS